MITRDSNSPKSNRNLYALSETQVSRYHWVQGKIPLNMVLFSYCEVMENKVKVLSAKYFSGIEHKARIMEGEVLCNHFAYF